MVDFPSNYNDIIAQLSSDRVCANVLNVFYLGFHLGPGKYRRCFFVKGCFGTIVPLSNASPTYKSCSPPPPQHSLASEGSSIADLPGPDGEHGNEERHLY